MRLKVAGLGIDPPPTFDYKRIMNEEALPSFLSLLAYNALKGPKQPIFISWFPGEDFVLDGYLGDLPCVGNPYTSIWWLTNPNPWEELLNIGSLIELSKLHILNSHPLHCFRIYLCLGVCLCDSQFSLWVWTWQWSLSIYMLLCHLVMVILS